MNILTSTYNNNGASSWWIYVIVIASILLFFFATNLVILMLTNRSQKKALTEYEKIVPLERERFDLICEVYTTLISDDRHLPKNMVELTEEVKKDFEEIPPHIEEIKGKNDFLVVYYSKYLKEKNMIKAQNYADYYEKLSKISYLSADEKNSPYSPYDKAVIRYNSYLNMGLFNIFKGKKERMPIL